MGLSPHGHIEHKERIARMEKTSAKRISANSGLKIYRYLLVTDFQLGPVSALAH